MKKSISIARESSSFPTIPLGLARSALFTVARPVAGLVLSKSIAIAPQRGAELFYTGPHLSQHHALAWQAVIQSSIRSDVDAGQVFSVSSDSLLRAMGGKGDDSKQRERLWRWLEDLTAARIEYKTDAQDYMGPLIFELARERPSGFLSIRLNPTLCHLFSNEVLRNDLERKASLGRNLLAMWLHDYIATHLRPPAESVETLRQRSGSSLALPQFRQRLNAAMCLLTKGLRPLVLAWSVDSHDRLNIQKTATSVVILPDEVANAKRGGARQQERQRRDVDRARQQRAGVAL